MSKHVSKYLHNHMDNKAGIEHTYQKNKDRCYSGPCLRHL